MRKPFYSVVNKSDSEVDLLIYGVIGGFNWDTWSFENTDKQLVNEFKALEDVYDRINIRVNSPGGSVWDGLPFINAIARSKKDIHSYNDGIAYSMGAMILMAPPKKENIHAAKNSLMLLHSVSDIAWTNAKGMRKVADDLEKYDQALAKSISDLTGMKEAEVLAKWFDGEDHLMTSSEALKDGLIGNVEDYKTENVPANIQNMNSRQVFAFYAKQDSQERENFVERIVNRVKTSVVEALSKNKPSNQISNDMNFEKTLKALKPEATDADRTAAIAEINQFTGTNEKFTKAEVDAKIADAVKAEEDKTAGVQTKLNEVTAEFDAFKKQPPAGSGKAPVAGKNDDIPDGGKELDMNQLSHNKLADSMIGAPIKKS